jgi:hypothetical protein
MAICLNKLVDVLFINLTLYGGHLRQTQVDIKGSLDKQILNFAL